MRSSIPFYDTLADHYDAHFDVPHRRAYDELAWEVILPLLPNSPGQIIDVGCGNGRCVGQMLERGHSVLGIEQSPRMATAARTRWQTDHFELIEGSMEQVQLPQGQADVVLALGSLQYTSDPAKMIKRLAGWTRCGGWVVVLVDSLVALVVELIAAGKVEEALQRLRTRQATWIQCEQETDYHLLDRDWLEQSFTQAGLEQIRVQGLLVGASALGRDRLKERLCHAPVKQMEIERSLASSRVLADIGKQLLAIGQRA